MQVRLRDPTLTLELVRFLRRARCTVDLLGPETVEVRVPDTDESQESLEVALYLHAWHALHPLGRADLVR